MKNVHFDVGIFNLGIFSLYSHNLNPIQANQAMDELFELVPMAEELGYKRYWLAEHYDKDAAWRNTEILISILAGMTSKIRIGAAGVLVKLYPPLLVAQNYRLLEYLYSGRIDMGLAKGFSPPDSMKALKADDKSEVAFVENTADLFKYLSSGFHTPNITVPPYHTDMPESWFLGYSSMELALKYKGNICLSIFHGSKTNRANPVAIADFRKQYEDQWGYSPKIAIAAAGVCMKTKAAAEKVLTNFRNQHFMPNIVGSPQDCYDEIMGMMHESGADEFIFADLCETMSQKRECYSLISEVLELKPLTIE